MRKRIITYAEIMNINPEELSERGVLNPTINSDVPLFVDPRLLKTSKHKIFQNASKTYDDFYENLAKKIRAYLKLEKPNDQKRPATTIMGLLTAKEPAGLCLGYSKNNTNGQGVGKNIAKLIFDNAINMYRLFPDVGTEVFSLLGLLSEGVGADYIGDITSNIILKEIHEFTESIAKDLKLPIQQYWLGDKVYRLPKHPNATERRNFPILFIARDILTDLPKDADFEDIFEGFINENDTIRLEINDKISNIIKSDLKKAEKQSRINEILKENSDIVMQIIEHIKTIEGTAYDFQGDPKGYLVRERLLQFFDEIKTDIKITKNDDNLKIIEYIIERFEKFIQHNNKLKRELLWKNEHEYKPETAWQQVFHTFINEILSICNIDVIPEKETGSGPVDFYFSNGSKLRVLAEFKLSTNKKLKDGLVKQLERYKECTDNVKAAYFICINVHKTKQSQVIFSELSKIKEKLNLNAKIIVIDGRIEQSASNL